MNPRVWRTSVVLCLLLGFTGVAGIAKADYLEIRRAALLKKSPRSDGAVLENLVPGVLVDLTSEDQKGGYYRVRTREGNKGYVYRTLVRRHPGSIPPDTLEPKDLEHEDEGTHEHPSTAGTGSQSSCGGKPLTVRFFDVGQALSVLVTFPGGEQMLVDAGEGAKRCGAPCRAWHQHLMTGLQTAVPSQELDVLWITHQHSDHLGGVEDMLTSFRLGMYVDNGTEVEKGLVSKSRDAAKKAGAKIRVVDPQHRTSPIADIPGVKLTPIVPSSWPKSCPANQNNCSIGLRIDYCQSSVLFTGDAESEEEELLDPKGHADLIQVGHHGSNTSSSREFLDKVRPNFAVISSGKPDEGTNRTYCHPIAATVNTLTNLTGGPGKHAITSFDASSVKCKNGTDDNWLDRPASDHLWATARDGDVVLVTTGDGQFSIAPRH